MKQMKTERAASAEGMNAHRRGTAVFTHLEGLLTLRLCYMSWLPVVFQCWLKMQKRDFYVRKLCRWRFILLSEMRDPLVCMDLGNNIQPFLPAFHSHISPDNCSFLYNWCKIVFLCRSVQSQLMQVGRQMQCATMFCKLTYLKTSTTKGWSDEKGAAKLILGEETHLVSFPETN